MCCSESNLNLIPITKGSNGPLDYTFDLGNSISLPGAHGEEIVRDLFTDIQVSNHPPFKPIFTCYISNALE